MAKQLKDDITEDCIFTRLHLENCWTKHRLGGPFFTHEEFQTLKHIVNTSYDPLQAPCRVRETCKFFYTYIVTHRRAKDFVNTHPSSIVARNSLGLTNKSLKRFADERYVRRNEPKWNVYSISLYFISFLWKSALLRTEEYIKENCFRLPRCDEHKECKEVKKWLNKKLKKGTADKNYFTCCNEPDCREFTSLTHLQNLFQDKIKGIYRTKDRFTPLKTVFQYADETWAFYTHRIFVHIPKTPIIDAIITLFVDAGLDADSPPLCSRGPKNTRNERIRDIWLKTASQFLDSHQNFSVIKYYGVISL